MRALFEAPLTRWLRGLVILPNDVTPLKGDLIISRAILSEIPRDLETAYTCTGFVRAASVCTGNSCTCTVSRYVCAHFRNAIFREPVGRPHGSIPTHFSLVLSLPSVPAFFASPPPLTSSLPYLHLACLRRRSCPFFLSVATKAKPGPANFARSPGPLRETSQRPAADSLAILTSPQSPNTNARSLRTSSCLLLSVMEKGVTTPFVEPERAYGKIVRSFSSL